MRFRKVQYRDYSILQLRFDTILAVRLDLASERVASTASDDDEDGRRRAEMERMRTGLWHRPSAHDADAYICENVQWYREATYPSYEAIGGLPRTT